MHILASSKCIDKLMLLGFFKSTDLHVIQSNASDIEGKAILLSIKFFSEINKLDMLLLMFNEKISSNVS